MPGDIYPYTPLAPKQVLGSDRLANTYGMLLHSRLELLEPEVKHLVEPDVPRSATRSS